MVHRLGFARNLKGQERGVIRILTSKYIVNKKLLALFVYVWYELCIKLYARGREVTRYLACFVELSVRNSGVGS